MDHFLQSAPTLSDNLERDLDFILSHSAPARFVDLGAEVSNAQEICLLDETRQYGGSFKYRGAVLGVSRHPEGVIACGSGNFLTAVGLAASRLGVSATLVLPADAPTAKREMVLNTGSELFFVPRSDFVNSAVLEAQARGLPLLHPFRDASMLVGSCSLGVELARAMKVEGSPDDAIVVACGGGGLAAGTSLGLRISGLENDVYVAEPEHYPRLYAAFNVSHPVEIIAQEQTICDALRVTQVGSLAFSILQKIGARTLAASDAGVIEAQAHLAQETGIQAEPSGALALAAILANELPKQYRKLWVIVCGGNV